jgi:hypothetical protein
MYVYFDLSQYDDPMEAVFYEEEFLEVTEETIENQRRWTTTYSQVLQQKGTGEFWLARWECGSTEDQDTDPSLTLTLVQPVEVTRVEYRPVCKTDKVWQKNHT